MTPLLQIRETELAELCRKFGVDRLYVFGSAVSGQFDPQKSDVDFLVRLADRRPTGAYAERYLQLAEGLEQLVGRRVDLVTEESIRNPHLRREIEANRQLVYERSHEQAAV